MSLNALKKKLKSKAYRDAFVEEHIAQGLAFQIRATRELRGWSQHQVGEKAGMQQELISRYENPDYGKFTLNTLVKLSSALDVALVVRFAPFSELASWEEDLTAASLAVPSFDNDRGFMDATIPKSTSDATFAITLESRETASPTLTSDETDYEHQMPKELPDAATSPLVTPFPVTTDLAAQAEAQ